MAIPISLLKMTESRATSVAVYGGAGMKKTHGFAGATPPALLLSVGEGGTGSLMPWIRRRRVSNSQEWVTYTQEDRKEFVALLDKDTKEKIPFGPNPLIDVIHFDNTRYEAAGEFIEVVANFDTNRYNSLGLDSLQEFSVQAQTETKGKGGFDKTMTEVNFGWVRAQEKSFQLLRRLRNLRDSGIFIYTTASEDIAKDYVKNPMEKRDRGEAAPEAYSVKGTVNAPGQLATGFPHFPDVLAHTKMVSGNIAWVTEPEMLPGGGAFWDAKDRYGRLEPREPANLRKLMEKIYGQDGAKAILVHGLNMVEEQGL